MGLYRYYDPTIGKRRALKSVAIVNSDGTNEYTPDQIKAIEDDLVAHKAENTSQAHLAKNIGLEDVENNFTAHNVEGAINELFTNVSNGKKVIATAITDMGQSASGSNTFSQLASLIRAIETGDYSIGDILSLSQLQLSKPIEKWNFTKHTQYVSKLAVDLDGNIYSASWDGTVKKINKNGNQVWSKTISPYHVDAMDIDGFGNLYVTDNSNDSIIKIDTNGVEKWTKKYNTLYGDVSDIVSANSYIYAGFFKGSIAKYDTSGESTWVKSFYSDNVNTMETHPLLDILYAVAGSTVKKINSSGNEVWSFPLPNNAKSIAADKDGNIYIGTSTGLLIKINSEGDEIWTRDVNSFDINDLVVDVQGNVYAVSFRNAYKYTSDGFREWTFEGSDRMVSIAIDFEQNIYTGGSSSGIITKKEKTYKIIA